MEEMNKLKALVKHWRAHNNEHATTYDRWVEKVRLAGNDEAERLLKEISDRTKEMTLLFTELEDILA